MPEPTTPPADPIAVREPEAERLTGLSGKSLKRATDRGEATGRFRVGNSVLFDVRKLRAWVAAKADAALAAPADSTP